MDISDNEYTNNFESKKRILPYQHTAITHLIDSGQSPYSSSKRESQSSSLQSNQQGNSSGDTGILDQSSSNQPVPDLKSATSATLTNLKDNVLKNIFENKYKYYKRLKQLPSQVEKSGSNTSLVEGQKPKKIVVDDAIKILEMILVEQESKMKEEFNQELEVVGKLGPFPKFFESILVYKKLGWPHQDQNQPSFLLQIRLNDQYDSFVRYNEEYIKSNNQNVDCSYLS